MKFSNNLRWLSIFVPLAKFYVNLDQIIAIKGYTTPMNKNATQIGSCINKGNNRYVIMLQTHEYRAYKTQQKRIKYKKYPNSIEDILGTLAHELAHIATWCRNNMHSPWHLYITYRISILFTRKLMALGIKNVNMPFPRINKILKKPKN